MSTSTPTNAFEDATGTDIASSLGDPGVDVTLFEADNATLEIGFGAKFLSLVLVLNTAASATIIPTFEYSDGAGGWTSFTPTDNTTGFTTNGSITWSLGDVTNWKLDTVNSIDSRYWVRITRTADTLGTAPIEDTLLLISISPIWDFSGSWDVGNDINASGETVFIGTFFTPGIIETVGTLGELTTALSNASTNGGGHIRIKPNTSITITSQLTVPTKTFLEGGGRESTVIVHGSGASAPILVTGTDCRIVGIGFDGASQSSPCVRLNSTFNFVMEECSFTETASTSIVGMLEFAGTGNRTIIRNCVFTGIDSSGVECIFQNSSGMNETLIESCQFIDFIGDAILQTSTANRYTVNNCLFHNIATPDVNSIGIRHDGGGMIVTNCVCINAGLVFATTGTGFVVYDGNVIDATGCDNGIVIGSGSSIGIISNNYIYNSNVQGILSNRIDCIVSGNTIDTCATYGIRLNSGSRQSITSNRILNCGTTGILVSAGNDHNIVNNYIENSVIPINYTSGGSESVIRDNYARLGYEMIVSGNTVNGTHSHIIIDSVNFGGNCTFEDVSPHLHYLGHRCYVELVKPGANDVTLVNTFRSIYGTADVTNITLASNGAYVILEWNRNIWKIIERSGTVTPDESLEGLIVDSNVTVGGSSGSTSSVIIDNSDGTEDLLIRKAADAGDVFLVDAASGAVHIGGYSAAQEKLNITGNVLLQNNQSYQALDSGGTSQTLITLNATNVLEIGKNTVGAPVLDQEYDTGSTSASVINSGAWQSFTIGTSGTLYSVEFRVQITNSPAPDPMTVNVTIYSGEGTGGSVLYSGGSVSVPSGSLSFREHILNSSVVVSANDVITLHIIPDVITNGFLGWIFVNPGTYTGGRSSFGTSIDFEFRNYITPNGTNGISFLLPTDPAVSEVTSITLGPINYGVGAATAKHFIIYNFYGLAYYVWFFNTSNGQLNPTVAGAVSIKVDYTGFGTGSNNLRDLAQPLIDAFPVFTCTNGGTGELIITVNSPGSITDASIGNMNNSPSTGSTLSISTQGVYGDNLQFIGTSDTQIAKFTEGRGVMFGTGTPANDSVQLSGDLTNCFQIQGSNNDSFTVDTNGNTVTVGHSNHATVTVDLYAENDCTITVEADTDSAGSLKPVLELVRSGGAAADIGLVGTAGNYATSTTVDSMYIGTNTAHPMLFFTDSTLRMTLDSSGDLNIDNNLSVDGKLTIGDGVLPDDTLLLNLNMEQAWHFRQLGTTTSGIIELESQVAGGVMRVKADDGGVVTEMAKFDDASPSTDAGVTFTSATQLVTGGMTISNAWDITNVSQASPAVITTDTAHGLANSDSVTIYNNSNTTVDINGTHTISSVTSTTFTIPIDTTTSSTGDGVVYEGASPTGGDKGTGTINVGGDIYYNLGGAEALDQSQTVTDQNQAFTDGSSHWQAIKHSVAGQLTRIDFKIGTSTNDPSSLPFDVTIYSGSGTGGTVVDSTTSAYVVSGGTTFYTYNLVNTVIVTAESTHTIEIEPNGSYTGFFLLPRADGLYTRGASSLGTHDWNFRSYITPVPSAYTNPDYVFEHAFDPNNKINKFIHNAGAKEYQDRLMLENGGKRMTISQTEEYVKENWRLPGISDSPAGGFKRFDLALEKLEDLFLHIVDMEQRVKTLESTESAG